MEAVKTFTVDEAFDLLKNANLTKLVIMGFANINKKIIKMPQDQTFEQVLNSLVTKTIKPESFVVSDESMRGINEFYHRLKSGHYIASFYAGKDGKIEVSVYGSEYHLYHPLTSKASNIRPGAQILLLC